MPLLGEGQKGKKWSSKNNRRENKKRKEKKTKNNPARGGRLE
jgi:hypothetical protein